MTSSDSREGTGTDPRIPCTVGSEERERITDHGPQVTRIQHKHFVNICRLTKHTGKVLSFLDMTITSFLYDTVLTSFCPLEMLKGMDSFNDDSSTAI